MARGGIYDQLGGGFHRYSTDARWLVPHFEKMLYDNALLLGAYVEALQATGDGFYRQIARETADYVLREMTRADGPFFSTQDADSEGVEGKFFVWSLAEVQQALGKEEAELFASVYDVTAEGNWEEHNILHRGRSDEQDAKLLGLPIEELRRRLAASKRTLFDLRSKRIWPGRDDKVLTSWNGLMIGALAQTAQVLDEPRYTEAAGRAADFILTQMRAPDGKLLRTTFAGAEPKLNGFLEDYAYLADALITLYETTFAPRWLDAALDLARLMIEEFWDDAEGGFFFTGRGHEQLIARTKDPHDNATPSGNAVAVTALLRLAKLTGRGDLEERAVRTLRLFEGLMSTAPMAAGQMLIALDFHLGPVQEFAVVGELDQAETKRVLALIRGGFRPNQVVCWKRGVGASEPVERLIPLLDNRNAQGLVTTYICENMTCRAPIVGARALEQVLG